ncbi:hypothetical protein GCM10009660_26390 [Catellatospora bangladeshensis]
MTNHTFTPNGTGNRWTGPASTIRPSSATGSTPSRFNGTSARSGSSDNAREPTFPITQRVTERRATHATNPSRTDARVAIPHPSSPG